MEGYISNNGQVSADAPKRVSKTWEASQRLKGSIVVIDKSILD